MAKMRIIKDSHRVQHFVEDLNGVPLQMILIPEGKFIMGAPESEKESRESERPQHPVEVATFFMGRYPITQVQWKAVAKMEKVLRDLQVNPSRWERNDLPVERVTWYDAIEFCARLSRHTGKDYRLPSEAEWEYACRAGTTTAFHFGETISTQLANYNGTKTYGKEEKGDYLKKTTAVDFFNVANIFGLSEMHGNGWEWCADPWHKNYEGAPKDGRVWDEHQKNDNHYKKITENLAELLEDERPRVRRGGSWDADPWDCRSAYRDQFEPGEWFKSDGLRLACGGARTK